MERFRAARALKSDPRPVATRALIRALFVENNEATLSVLLLALVPVRLLALDHALGIEPRWPLTGPRTYKLARAVRGYYLMRSVAAHLKGWLEHEDPYFRLASIRWMALYDIIPEAGGTGFPDRAWAQFLNVKQTVLAEYKGGTDPGAQEGFYRLMKAVIEVEEYLTREGFGRDDEHNAEGM